MDRVVKRTWGVGGPHPHSFIASTRAKYTTPMIKLFSNPLLVGGIPESSISIKIERVPRHIKQTVEKKQTNKRKMQYMLVVNFK